MAWLLVSPTFVLNIAYVSTCMGSPSHKGGTKVIYNAGKILIILYITEVNVHAHVMSNPIYPNSYTMLTTQCHVAVS